jgi:hypothetical protein
VVLERFKDLTLKEKIEKIDKGEIHKLLNNPSYWYPCDEILSISLTEKGIEYLEREMPKHIDKINERFSGKWSYCC